uniref:Putative plant transposon protein domain-containing protein n=1 Tax=Solanum tuberosum TaxID=4113 RepID=M1DB20_SOLTU
MVREFYASYAATLRESITKRSKPLAQDPLTSTMVRGCPVDISPATISRFLYGPTTGHSWSLNTSEFDYRWDSVRSGAFQKNAEQREAVILWLARYIAADGERAEWVATPRLGIRKATMTFVAKFFWLLRRQEKEARRASIAEEELRQRRVRERSAGASSSAPVAEVQPMLRDLVSTTDGAEQLIESTTEGARIGEAGTTEVAPTDVPAGLGKSDPPAC